MSPMVRRRPLLRAAAVGGGAYMAGRASARRSAERAEQEDEQEARIADLERAQQRQESARPAEASRAGSPSLLDQLSQLTAMRERGELSDAEFAAAKARLLG